MAQRMPLELYDMWSGYQTPAMAAMLELPAEARRAWAAMPCGDVEDLDATPVLGRSERPWGWRSEASRTSTRAPTWCRTCTGRMPTCGRAWMARVTRRC